MPLFGELELDVVAARIPRLRDLDTEAWALPRAEILQLAWEVEDDTRALLPRAMHPAVPPYVTLVISAYPESPVGPFAMAQLRLMGRAGAHPRGYVLGAVATTPAAVEALRGRWGFPIAQGAVTLRSYYDRVAVVVTRDGAPILDASLLDPHPISGAQVQYMHSVTLAYPEASGGAEPLLVQVDPHYTFHRAERGRPDVRRFDGAAWNAGGLGLLTPISASFTSCDTDIPQIRFVMDVARPVVQGTRKIR